MATQGQLTAEDEKRADRLITRIGEDFEDLKNIFNKRKGSVAKSPAPSSSTAGGGKSAMQMTHDDEEDDTEEEDTDNEDDTESDDEDTDDEAVPAAQTKPSDVTPKNPNTNGQGRVLHPETDRRKKENQGDANRTQPTATNKATGAKRQPQTQGQEA